MRAVTAGLAALLFAQICVAAWTGELSSTLWKLDSADGTVRWLEIRNLPTAAEEGLYHVQIMQRLATDPVWAFKLLAPHMAVTAAALRASIVSPLKRGFAYPERFESGYQAWKDAQLQRRAFVCETTVNACLAKILQP